MQKKKYNKQWLMLLFLWVMQVSTLQAEEKEKLEEPMLETIDLSAIYSDNGVVVAALKAPKRWQYASGNVFFPEGIHATFYDKNKKVVGTLSANQAYQDVDKKVYDLKGDVEIKSYQDQKMRQVNTEELYWDLEQQEVYTDTFVRIESEEELLTGYGMFAKQDLSYYRTALPQGFTHVEAMEEQLAKK